MTQTPPTGAVLFDIDGTLVDSNYLHADAWWRALAEAGRPVDAWRVHRAIGMGSEQLLESLLGEDADDVGETATERHSELYRRSAELLRPFAGARDLVRAVAARGARAVLATSAGPDELELLLRTLDVEDALSAVTSAQDVDAAKPEPDLLHAALERVGLPPDRVVFLGDTVWDVEASRRAGVPCVGVLTGGTSEAELREAGAVAVYRDVAALLDGLDESPLAVTWTTPVED